MQPSARGPTLASRRARLRRQFSRAVRSHPLLAHLPQEGPSPYSGRSHGSQTPPRPPQAHWRTRWRLSSPRRQRYPSGPLQVFGRSAERSAGRSGPPVPSVMSGTRSRRYLNPSLTSRAASFKLPLALVSPALRYAEHRVHLREVHLSGACHCRHDQGRRPARSRRAGPSRLGRRRLRP